MSVIKKPIHIYDVRGTQHGDGIAILGPNNLPFDAPRGAGNVVRALNEAYELGMIEGMKLKQKEQDHDYSNEGSDETDNPSNRHPRHLRSPVVR